MFCYSVQSWLIQALKDEVRQLWYLQAEDERKGVPVLEIGRARVQEISWLYVPNMPLLTPAF